MRLSRAFPIGLAALTACSLLAPTVGAHNTAKYSNVPFVVPGLCGTATANFVPLNGALGLLETVTSNTGLAGFEIYCSSPSTGTLPTTTTGTFSQGNFTCNYTSSVPLVANTNFFGGLLVNNAGTTESTTPIPTVTSNTITLACTNTSFNSAPVIVARMGVESASGVTTTVTFSNFRYNNSPILYDMTVIDSSSATNTAGTFDFCF